MNTVKQENIYTADEFLAMTDLPERCELIDGEIYDMAPSPNFEHQNISIRLARRIGDYIDANHGKCIVLTAPFDVKLDEYRIVQPDILVVCDPDKFDKNKCNGAPDWVIEVLSPSNILHDTNTKLYLYAASGVREYWIVDPENKKVIVYLFGKPNIIGLYTFEDDIPVTIYKDAPVPLNIRLSDILPEK